MPQICPHDLFVDNSRASQLAAGFIDLSRLMVLSKENFATHIAALVLPTLGDNRLRHAALQRFMLANDSVTIAVEVPIWLTPDHIAKLEQRHRIRLLPSRSRRQPITGHIDFLQVRNGAVHILDYKPDARSNRPIAQLTLYALALSQLVGKLFEAAPSKVRLSCRVADWLGESDLASLQPFFDRSGGKPWPRDLFVTLD